MTLAEAFIPEDRRRALATGSPLPAHATGTALFADISGFTPLTEKLAQQFGPRRGAELLTDQLNTVYTALIEAVEAWGGSVIGFSGDAIACWFVDGDELGARAAAGCAQAMQRAMSAFAVVKVTAAVEANLALKTALATGTVMRLVVGDPAIQSIDVIAGATLDALADVEHSAGQGEVIADAATVAALGDLAVARVTRTSGEGRTVTVLEPIDALCVQPEPPPIEAVVEELARAWVLPAVYARLRTEQGRFLAELRPATALFLQFSGLDFDHDPEAGVALDAFICWVQRVVARYEGAVIQLTTGDKGSYLYVALGATITHDDDAMRAVAVALELRHPPAALAKISGIRMGISQGLMRVGPYGSANRLTFGALGDATNLAARLMTQSGIGEIWLSEQSAEAVTPRYELAALGARQFKGKAMPQQVFGVVGPRARTAHAFAATGEAPLVGRTAELAILRAAVADAQKGRGGTVRLEGEAGSGKSHLAAHFVQQIALPQLRVVLAACQSTAQNIAYFAIQQAVRSLLALDDGGEESKELLAARLEAAVRQREPAWLLRLPLLGELLGLPIADNPTTAAFDAHMRQEALAALLVEITTQAAREQPLLIVVEDAHWLDEASRRLFLAMGRVAPSAGLLLLLVQRPLGAEQEALAAQLAELPGQRQIGLTELDRISTAQLVTSRLRGAVEPLALDYIHTLAQGNPFFTEELVDALREGELLNAIEGDWRLTTGLVESLRRANCLEREDEIWRLANNARLSAVEVGVPSSIHGLVLSRLDRLPEAAKLTLKVASVIGRVFEINLLAAAHPSAPRPEYLAGEFALFQARDFARLESPEPHPTYIFKHNITQEVVYQTLLESQRQELHLAVARALEARDPSAVEQLAHHFAHGDVGQPAVRAKAVEYVDASARRAQHEHANETALVYFDQALQWEMRWEWLKGRTEALHVLGRRIQEEATLVAMEAIERGDPNRQLEDALLWAKFHAATGDYAQALVWTQLAHNLAEGMGDRRRQALCFNQEGLIAWRQGAHADATRAYTAALAIGADDSTLVDVASEARYGLGLVARQQSRFDLAREQFEEDLAVNRQLGNRQNEARALNALGAVASLEREHAMASDYFQQALRMREMIGDRAGVGTSLMSLAQVYGNLGDYSRVEPLLHKALAIQEAVDNPWEEMLILNELGILYTAVGEYERAYGYLERGLQRSRMINSAIGEAYILCNLGQAQRDAGQVEVALVTLAQGLALAREQEDTNLEAIYLGDLAMTQLRAGDPTAAAMQARQSCDLSFELEQPLSATGVLATAAAAQMALGNFEQASQSVQEALRILDECGGEGPDYPQRDYWLCSQVLQMLQQAGVPVEAAQLTHARRRAGELLTQRAANISDPVMRDSYLYRVGVHSEIQEYLALDSQDG